VTLSTFPRRLVMLFVLCTASVLAIASPPDGDKPPASSFPKNERRTMLDQWKAQHKAPATSSKTGIHTDATGGTVIVGRASMVINDNEDILYTQNWLGAENNCEVYIYRPNQFLPNTTYQAGDHIRTCGNFMATNSGNAGVNPPTTCTTTGATDTPAGSAVTWKYVEDNRQPSTTYTEGMVVRASSGQQGFTFRAEIPGAATTGATSASATEPNWPTVGGGTVVDGAVTWRAEGFFPGSFRNCNPMSLAIRHSAGGDTVIAKEGDALSAYSQLSGWGEFVAMNDSGKAAFRAAVSGLLTDEDEGGSGIFTAGPGAGQLTQIAETGDTVGGITMAGMGTMVAINNAGQVLWEGYADTTQTWQANHAYSGCYVYVLPTTPNGFHYYACVSGTSGATEPVWPTVSGNSVNDNGINWTAQTLTATSGDEDSHHLIRFTPPSTQTLIVGIGSTVAGSTVIGFGGDDTTDQTNCCAYSDPDGLINTAGHVPAVLRLASGKQVAQIFRPPSAAITVADTNSGPYAIIEPRIAINNSDQVVFKVAMGSGYFWLPNHAYSSGDIVYPAKYPGETKGSFKYVAQNGGTSGTNAPSWPTTLGSTTTDNDITWKAEAYAPDELRRFTPPSTVVTIAAVGDDVGAASGGSPSGVTFTSFGNFTDINSIGHVVFRANTDDGQEGFYFWNGSTIRPVYVQPDSFGLASEMITLNDSDEVAYVTGSRKTTFDDSDDDHSEGVEANDGSDTSYRGARPGGIFFWKNGATQTAIALGDVIGGDDVTAIYAQHQVFRKRQFNQNGCLATSYAVNGDDGEMDAEEGDPSRYTKSPLIFTTCSSVQACAAILVSPPTLPGATQGVAYSQQLAASGGSAPYTFAVASGALPAGLTLSSGGLLSGTPTDGNTYNFSISATDVNGCAGVAAYTLTPAAAGQVNVSLSPAFAQIDPGTNQTYTVTISESQGTDTTIDLASSDPTIASVPLTVTILAGNTTANFDASGLLDGTVTITATGPAGAPFNSSSATATLQVGAPTAIPLYGPLSLLLLGLALAVTGVLVKR
jgi:hypothetical protein